jgi:hypothetical protein
MKETFVTCDCSSEALHISFDEEDNTCCISIYKLETKPTLTSKLRHVWKILTTGTPYGDQVIINKTKVKKLYDFLGGIVNDN